MVWARQLLLTLLVSCNAAESLPKWELQDPARAEQNINELTSILFGAHGKGINPSKELKYWKSPCCGKESSTEQEGMLICMGFQMLLHTNTNSHVHSIGSLQKWWMDAGCSPGALLAPSLLLFEAQLWPGVPAAFLPRAQTQSQAGECRAMGHSSVFHRGKEGETCKKAAERNFTTSHLKPKFNQQYCEETLS